MAVSAHDTHHEHEETWGDYNAEEAGESVLPAISATALAVFCAALLALLAATAFFSFEVVGARNPTPKQHSNPSDVGSGQPMR